MAPISPVMRRRYDAAAEEVRGFLLGGLPTCNIESISEAKGMFSRCLHCDQWDWFSVQDRLGILDRRHLHEIPNLLTQLRDCVKQHRDCGSVIERAKRAGVHVYLGRFLGVEKKPHVAGWIYVLSTKQLPGILKIGRTDRSLVERVREINSATGVVFPYSVRAIFPVEDSVKAESAVHSALDKYRVRGDREFFAVEFGFAAGTIRYTLEGFTS